MQRNSTLSASQQRYSHLSAEWPAPPSAFPHQSFAPPTPHPIPVPSPISPPQPAYASPNAPRQHLRRREPPPLTYISYVDVDENMDIDPSGEALEAVNGTGGKRRSRFPRSIFKSLRRLPRSLFRSRASSKRAEELANAYQEEDRQPAAGPLRSALLTPPPEIQVEYSDHGTIRLAASPRETAYDSQGFPIERQHSQRSHHTHEQDVHRTYSQGSWDPELLDANQPRQSVASTTTTTRAARRPLPETPNVPNRTSISFPTPMPIPPSQSYQSHMSHRPSQRSHASHRSQPSYSRSAHRQLPTHTESPSPSPSPPPTRTRTSRRPATFTTFSVRSTTGTITSVRAHVVRIWRFLCDLYHMPWVASRVAEDFVPVASSARSRERVTKRYRPPNLAHLGVSDNDGTSWYTPSPEQREADLHHAGHDRQRAYRYDTYTKPPHRRRHHHKPHSPRSRGASSTSGSVGYTPATPFTPYAPWAPWVIPPGSPSPTRTVRPGNPPHSDPYDVYRAAQPVYVVPQEGLARTPSGRQVPDMQRMQAMYMVPAYIPAPPPPHPSRQPNGSANPMVQPPPPILNNNYGYQGEHSSAAH
ncbi:hypothetical protein BD410DRAFT_284428 [Rickenella mellea]|uniref:Uncharacterized protein n=1 Tax=Rickenella mellea TaxID=50990 RepID=A0A4Y7Q4R4_9AGAM|nr:hypothetical protein BD410DRAFT_284428 [Rickenella mellea]